MKRRGNFNKKDQIEWALMIAFFMFFSVFCSFIATESVIILNSPEKIVLEYQGEFEVEIIKGRRNTCYLFKLNNGDKVSVPAVHISNKSFVNVEKCVFKYSKWVNFRNRHRGLSIQSLNGEEFLDKNSIKIDLKFSVIPFYLISLLIMLWSLFLVLLPYADKIIFGIKKRRKMKEIKKKKQLKQMKCSSQNEASDKKKKK